MSLPQTSAQELRFIKNLHLKAFGKVTALAKKQLPGTFSLPPAAEKLIGRELKPLETRFIEALKLSARLAKRSLAGKMVDYRRLAANNRLMKRQKLALLSVFPHTANVWVIDGLVFTSQTAGLKNLSGLNPKSAAVIDVLNSAASVSLGFHNPWLIKADRYEDHLNIRDNYCTAYHPATRHLFALQSLKKLHPNYPRQKEFFVHAESSGTIVDSVAIESAVSFAETNQPGKMKKILAVDGTWCGGYGTAREATGFGVDAQQKQRSGGSLWVERILPPPTKENRVEFLRLITRAVKNKTAAGLYLEPDVIGDLGMIATDKETLNQTVALLKKARLPIILDCVQQLGRSGSYWGENVDTIFKGYPSLIVTTAKSASNGQPFGFTIVPTTIMTAARPLTQITTNQMNGPLLRALVVAEVLSDQSFQSWLQLKSAQIEMLAQKYGFDLGENGLRGKFLNRGIYVGDNETVKLVQIALLVEHGILVGALPQTVRYQPMLLELSATNRLVAKTIFKKINEIKNGEISPAVEKFHRQMTNKSSGLARKNK